MFCCLCLLAAGCSADTAFIQFAALVRADSPNDALACPAGTCTAKVDLVTELVALTPRDLAERVVGVLRAEPRTELVARSDDGLRFVFVQRSLLFRFPDTVNIAVLPIDGDKAGIAIYSRSNYGYGDFGVNRARVEGWLAILGIPTRPAP
ncbi:DUF1499 domain-containing protein [Dongia sp.]|uniref:DUF1499 domain-containing protein n=1 Tax=Dongia sp. TaxID=1977262 RepID=UPI0035B323A9